MGVVVVGMWIARADAVCGRGTGAGGVYWFAGGVCFLFVFFETLEKKLKSLKNCPEVNLFVTPRARLASQESGGRNHCNKVAPKVGQKGHQRAPQRDRNEPEEGARPAKKVPGPPPN